MTYYQSLNKDLAFSDYIKICRNHILKQRLDLSNHHADKQIIINANSPFEFTPKQSSHNKRIGALLIHGLLDSPFTMQEIASLLAQQGILCRGILLPGHGTKPDDLLKVNHQNWLESVAYGINSFNKHIDELYLIGYSTGAALAIFHALQNHNIAGVVLISPCIKVRPLIENSTKWYEVIERFTKQPFYIQKKDNLDYAKYLSIPLKATQQVIMLTKKIAAMKTQILPCPSLMILTEQDETISTPAALDMFKIQSKQAQLLLYTSKLKQRNDERIEQRNSFLPEKNILHFSHRSLPFSIKNPHYGQNGDYLFTSHAKHNNLYYGAFNIIQIKLQNQLANIGLTKIRYRELSYNPDHNHMMQRILDFLL